MDDKPNRPRDEESRDLPQIAHDDSSDIVPLPGVEPAPPPVNIDERDSNDVSPVPIELPDPDDRAVETADQIDEHQPLPIPGTYHDNDTTEPDPYDVDDSVDLTMPLPTRDPESEVDDASTDEELDVDTAPDRRIDDAGLSDRIRYAPDYDEVPTGGERIYVGGPDDDPINDESDFFESASDDDTQADTGEPDAEHVTAAGTDEAAPAPPEADTGETTCPVCGRQTDALRFCGHCGASLTEGREPYTSSTMAGRLQERAERLLSPLGHWTRPGGVRFIMAAGALLVLLALLANSGALALMIGAAILPSILVFWCLHRDIFEKESLLVLTGIGLAGTLSGAILGWLGSLIVASTWFDTGVLNYGAAGLGGAFAEDAGVPPFLAWSLVGIIFPLLALAAIVGVPMAMRQTVSLRNEVMDGLTLGALMGAGVSLGSAIVFAAPMLTHGGPISDASTWTLTVIGLTVIRPLVWTLCGGLLGAATWRYLLSGQIGSALIPAIIGAAGVLLFTFVSIEISASGLWTEILWGVIVAIVVGFFYMRAMNRAIAHDRRILGNDDTRIVCPHCHQVTPKGDYCAHCGQELAGGR